jgi:hypothetical protein
VIVTTNFWNQLEIVFWTNIYMSLQEVGTSSRSTFRPLPSFDLCVSLFLRFAFPVDGPWPDTENFQFAPIRWMGPIRNPNRSTSGMRVTLSYLSANVIWNILILKIKGDTDTFFLTCRIQLHVKFRVESHRCIFGHHQDFFPEKN